MVRDYMSEMAGIEAPAEEQVTWWKHTPTVIGGILTFIGDVDTKDYGPQQVIKIRAEDGEVFARSINGQLQTQLDRNRGALGDEVALGGS